MNDGYTIETREMNELLSLGSRKTSAHLDTLQIQSTILFNFIDYGHFELGPHCFERNQK